MLDVLLVEDDLDLAATVVQYLELENIRCDHAGNGASGLELMQQHNYDALLLDLNLPRMDGLAVCEKLRDLGRDTPVLMITARDQLQDKLAGFKAGTDDFLVKPFELEELVVRLHAISRRRSGQSRLLQCDDLLMDLTAHQISRAGQQIKLSPTGWALLETLLRASPDAVSRQKLLAAVWGDEIPDSNCLKVHIFNLRKAIDHGFPNPLLQTVSGFGFSVSKQ